MHDTKEHTIGDRAIVGQEFQTGFDRIIDRSAGMLDEISFDLVALMAGANLLGSAGHVLVQLVFDVAVFVGNNESGRICSTWWR